MNAGATKGREEVAVPATTTNAKANAMPGSPPASAVAAATAADDNDNDDNNDDDDNNNDDNDDDDNDNNNLDALCRRVCNLRRMLNASTDCLANAKADAAVARVECPRTLELAERRAGEQICQVKEELRRTRIKAKRFRVGWTRLRTGVGGRGRKRRAEGASVLALLLAAAAAEADNAPPPVAFWGAGRGSASPPPAPPPPTPPSIVVVAEDPQRDCRRGGR